MTTDPASPTRDSLCIAPGCNLVTASFAGEGRALPCSRQVLFSGLPSHALVAWSRRCSDVTYRAAAHRSEVATAHSPPFTPSPSLPPTATPSMATSPTAAATNTLTLFSGICPSCHEPPPSTCFVHSLCSCYACGMRRCCGHTCIHSLQRLVIAEWGRVCVTIAGEGGGLHGA